MQTQGQHAFFGETHMHTQGRHMQPSQDPGICPGIWIRSGQLPGGQDPVSELLLGGQDPGAPKTPAKDPAPGANQLNLQHTQQPKVQAWQPPSKKLIFKPFFFIGAAPCPHVCGINAATLVGHGPHQARIQGDPIGSGLCGPGSKVGVRRSGGHVHRTQA